MWGQWGSAARAGGGDCVFLLWLLFCVTCICLCRPPVLWPLPYAQSAVCYTPWPLCWWCRSLSPQSPSTPDLCQPPTCSSETRNMFLSTSPQVLQLYTFFTWIFKIFYLGNKKLSQLILKLLSAAPTFTMGSPQQVSLHIFKCQKLFQLSC